MMSPKIPTVFHNILVVRTDRIGDVVLTIPAVRALKKAFPQARISMWVASSTRELVEGLPFVDEVLVEDRTKGWAGYREFLTRLRSKKFDLAVNYHTKRRTNLSCFLAGIPGRLGFRNNKFGWLLNLPVQDRRHLGERHEAEYCLDLLRAVGVKSADTSLELPPMPQAEAWVSGLLRDKRLSGVPLIAFHPDANSPSKCWPAESFARLADRLAQSLHARILLVGGGSARRAAGDILSQVTGEAPVDLTGSTTVAQMAALFRHCQLVISNDSGPVHVAAAAGVPVISLFLRSQPGINPKRWRPLGAKSVLLCNKEGEEILLDRQGNVASGSLASISVDEVLAQALCLLKGPLDGH